MAKYWPKNNLSRLTLNVTYGFVNLELNGKISEQLFEFNFPHSNCTRATWKKYRGKNLLEKRKQCGDDQFCSCKNSSTNVDEYLHVQNWLSPHCFRFPLIVIEKLRLYSKPNQCRWTHFKNIYLCLWVEWRQKSKLQFLRSFVIYSMLRLLQLHTMLPLSHDFHPQIILFISTVY